MNKATRAGISIAIALITLGIITATSFAAGSRCQVIYGGGEVCEKEVSFTLDKKIQKPTKGGEFVDNLSINDERFAAGQDVAFKIILQNTGEEKITVHLTDTLPQYLEFLSGGDYNNDNRTVTNNVELNPNEKKEVTIVTRIVSEDKLPQDKSVSCVTNTARGTVNTGATAEDAAQFCIERQMIVKKPTPQVFEDVPVKKIPETGPEMLPLFALIPAGIAGFTLRRKSKLN